MHDRFRRISDEQSRCEDGFTLIELLIVIVVLGILAAVTVFGLSNISGQSLTSACHADAKSVAVAQEAYRAQNQSYAQDVGTLVTSPAPGPYLRSLPGNTTKYTITTSTNGKVIVTNVKTSFSGDFEAPAPAVDPCAGL
jgi:prepilin-type N-terminal cleavage/methylation domain-containing protein